MLPSRRRTLLCLSLAGLLTFGWIRSYYHADTIGTSTATTRSGIGIAQGCVALVIASQAHGPPFAEQSIFYATPKWKSAPSETVGGYPTFDLNRLGFRVLNRDFNKTTTPPDSSPLYAGSWDSPPNVYVDRTVLALPFWFVILLSLTPLLPPLLRHPQLGHCPACGYDLRATPTRCPECGTDNPLNRR